MKPITFSDEFQKQLQKIAKKDPRLINKIKRQLLVFQKNPHHPSLRLHKLKGNLANTWSLSVTTSYRLLYIDTDSYYFFSLGEHSQIYQ